jgi:serine/threonine protein kinase
MAGVAGPGLAPPGAVMGPPGGAASLLTPTPGAEVEAPTPSAVSAPPSGKLPPTAMPLPPPGGRGPAGRVVETLAPEHTDGPTEAGTVLGTYAYMPPEQACGEVGRLDRRCDVFGLGAILCEILTGQPPYDGGGREELKAQAQVGHLGPAWQRLEACGAFRERNHSVARTVQKRLSRAQPQRRSHCRLP